MAFGDHLAPQDHLVQYQAPFVGVLGAHDGGTFVAEGTSFFAVEEA